VRNDVHTQGQVLVAGREPVARQLIRQDFMKDCEQECSRSVYSDDTFGRNSFVYALAHAVQFHWHGSYLT
jgi:hypothetical protein